MVRTLSQNWWLVVLRGVLGILLGLLAFVWPGLATLVILYVIAAWAVFTRILEIVAAVRLRHEITNEWILALGGVISIAVGVLLFFQPAASSLAIIWIIGAYAFIFGVLLVVLGFRLRTWRGPDSLEPIPSP